MAQTEFQLGAAPSGGAPAAQTITNQGTARQWMTPSGVMLTEPGTTGGGTAATYSNVIMGGS